MAGKTQYQLAREAFSDLKGKVLSLSELTLEVKKRLASSSTAAQKYLKMMSELGLTTEIEPFKFKIN